MVKELEKIDNATFLIEQTIQGIESAMHDVNVFEAMKEGDQVLKELRSRVSVEQFEELYDDHQDRLAQEEEEQKLFGQVLDQDELEADLDKLMADDVIADEEQIPDAPTVPIAAQEAAEEDREEEEAPKR